MDDAFRVRALDLQRYEQVSRNGLFWVRHRLRELRSPTSLCQLGLGAAPECAARKEQARCLTRFTARFDNPDWQTARAIRQSCG